MPFIRGDMDAYNEIVEELGEDAIPGGPPSADFEYEEASARFDRQKLGELAGALLDALRAAGATAFVARYDGGFDEGFAYAEQVVFGNSNRPSSQVARTLKDATLQSVLQKQKSNYVAELSQERKLDYAFDELAGEFATLLLGQGFGTGEYQLYGAFTADLVSGEITDHPDAEKPKDMED